MQGAYRSEGRRRIAEYMWGSKLGREIRSKNSLFAHAAGYSYATLFEGETPSSYTSDG